MGTDIHLSVETRKPQPDGTLGPWEHVPGPIITCWACDGTGTDNRTGDPCYWCGLPVYSYPGELDQINVHYIEPGKYRDTWYSDRNYTVFAILAGVRNGYGFAGHYRHEPVTPIAEGRGIPDDITHETGAILSDEHSGTWMTLEEIFHHDWDALVYSSNEEPVAERECAAEFLASMKVLALEVGEQPTRLIMDFDS